MSDNTYLKPGIFLFINILVTGIGNWFFWIMISYFTSTSVIGKATTVISFVLLVSLIIQIGFEYPLLKKSSLDRSKTLISILVTELILSLSTIPFIFYFMGIAISSTFISYAILLLFLFSISFVTRFFLLGISDSKKVLTIESISTVLRFVSGLVLIFSGFEVLAIILSFVVQYIFIVLTMLLITKKYVITKIPAIKYFKEIIKEGIVNTPAKLSRMFVVSLSIVLLASFGIDDSEIGVFYIALMISIMGGSFASSMAYMVIPASSFSKSDLSSNSLRISINFTSPIITLLLIAPKGILALIGPNYVSADIILMILALGILPSVIVVHAIAKFNNLFKRKELLVMGGLQIVTFLLSFWFLVPQYGTIGAAISVVSSFIPASLFAMALSDRKSIKYIITSIISIISGYTVGYLMILVPNMPIFGVVTISMVVSFAVIIFLKNTTMTEINQLMKSLTK